MPGLEDYELVRVLAQGGMGVVHEAVERRVAGWVVRTVARAGLGDNDSHGLLLLADDRLRRAGDDALRRQLEADRADLDALATNLAPVERADLLWRLGRYGAAAALLAELEVESPDPALTLRRADALRRDGDLSGADAAYQRLVRADAPERFQKWAHLRLAELAIDQGQPTAALTWVDAGLALGQLPPRDVALFELERARALGQLERWPEALSSARAAADGLARAAAEEDDDARAVTRSLRARALAVMGEALAVAGREADARGLLLEALRAVTPLPLDGFHLHKREVHERALRALPRDREVQRWADLAFP